MEYPFNNFRPLILSDKLLDKIGFKNIGETEHSYVKVFEIVGGVDDCQKFQIRINCVKEDFFKFFIPYKYQSDDLRRPIYFLHDLMDIVETNCKAELITSFYQKLYECGLYDFFASYLNYKKVQKNKEERRDPGNIWLSTIGDMKEKMSYQTFHNIIVSIFR